jgi:hypothetical protein
MRYTRGLWYMGQRSSVYLSDDLAAAVKASGVPLAELVRRGLTASSEPEVLISRRLLSVNMGSPELRNA